MGRRGADWRDLRARAALVLGFWLHLCALVELLHPGCGELFGPERTSYEQRHCLPERTGVDHQPIRGGNAQSTVLVKIGIGRGEPTTSDFGTFETCQPRWKLSSYR